MKNINWLQGQNYIADQRRKIDLLKENKLERVVYPYFRINNERENKNINQKIIKEKRTLIRNSTKQTCVNNLLYPLW